MLISSKTRLKNRLKEIVKKGQLRYPISSIEEPDDSIHPEIEQEIKEQIEEIEEEEAEGGEVIAEEPIAEEPSKPAPAYDLTGDYPDDEMPYEVDPTDNVIEEFREGVAEYSDNSQDTSDLPEEMASTYEQLRVKYLQELKILPDGPGNHLNWVRAQLKKIFLASYI